MWTSHSRNSSYQTIVITILPFSNLYSYFLSFTPARYIYIYFKIIFPLYFSFQQKLDENWLHKKFHISLFAYPKLALPFCISLHVKVEHPLNEIMYFLLPYYPFNAMLVGLLELLVALLSHLHV